MTKREEIREAIGDYTDNECLYPDKDCKWRREPGYCGSTPNVAAYKCLMKHLDEIGVVIKVDRELPDTPYWKQHRRAVEREVTAELLKAGYVAVETLIEEGE